MELPIQDVMQIIRTFPNIIIAIEKNGKIRNCVGIKKTKPSPAEFYRIMKDNRNKGCVISILQQDVNVTKEKIKVRIQESIKSSGFFDSLETEIEKLNRERKEKSESSEK